MKKIFLICVTCLSLVSCNRQIIDNTWAYKYADIQGVGTVEITSWIDYENSDIVQVRSIDGTVYLTHYANVVLRTK